jgi:hypothetical protein
MIRIIFFKYFISIRISNRESGSKFYPPIKDNEKNEIGENSDLFTPHNLSYRL